VRVTPAAELHHRHVRMQKYMAEEGLDAAICVQNADLFYFTGTVQSGCFYLPACGPAIYMVRRDIGRARSESLLQEIIPFNSFKDIPRILAEYSYPQPTRIGMELDVVPVNFFERYRDLFPAAVFKDVTPLIRRVRMIKSSYELQIMQEAAGQVDRVFRRAIEVIREGITDLELASELEFTARRLGHLGFTRMRLFNGEMLFGHAFSGSDSALPAYTDTPFGGAGPAPSFGQGAGFKIIGRNEPIVVDFAGSLDGYLVDQTRVLAIGGLPDRLRRGYDDMCTVQERMKALAPERPTWGALYEECWSLALSLGYADQFMGAKGSQVSFIGHGIGVELDEYPFIARGQDRMVLEPGMAFAFEPKLVFTGEGAVGIENSFYLDGDGALRQLTLSPEELIIL